MLISLKLILGILLITCRQCNFCFYYITVLLNTFCILSNSIMKGENNMQTK